MKKESLKTQTRLTYTSSNLPFTILETDVKHILGSSSIKVIDHCRNALLNLWSRSSSK
jgi:hypothetical protein